MRAGDGDGREASAELSHEFKERLKGDHSVGSVNTVLAALNAFFKFMGREECKTRRLRTQKKTFCPEEKVLNRAEYDRIMDDSPKKSREFEKFHQNFLLTT